MFFLNGLTHCGLLTIWVNIGSGKKNGSDDGLLPIGTKPFPEPLLTYYQQGPVTPIWGQLHNNQLLKSYWQLIIKNSIQISRG